MGRRRRASRHHGVLVVDKSKGPTSHDIVGRVRRAFDTGAVGHAGTLDPMATGVLVIAVGEATKLVAHLTAADKEYEATISLGSETDSHDADGRVVRTAEVPPLTRAMVESAAARFVGPFRQRPPVVSAIKVDGRPLHERVRRGEVVEAPERDVFVHALEIRDVTEREIRLVVRAAKGFYVRALGRDLAEALGTVGHLNALRRTRSGEFGLAEAVPAETVFSAASGDASDVAALLAALMTLEDAWSGPRATLTPEGIADARHGRPVVAERRGPIVGEGEVIAMLDEDGGLVALGRLDESGVLAIARGFASTASERDGRFPS